MRRGRCAREREPSAGEGERGASRRPGTAHTRARRARAGLSPGFGDHLLGVGRDEGRPDVDVGPVDRVGGEGHRAVGARGGERAFPGPPGVDPPDGQRPSPVGLPGLLPGVADEDPGRGPDEERLAWGYARASADERAERSATRGEG